MTALDARALPADSSPRGATVGPLRCSRTATLGDRILLQVRGIDTWNVSLRMRQALLCGSGRSREARLDADHRLAVLQRTQVAVVASTARALASRPAPMLCPTPTAVVAHHHPWLRARACALLREHGFTVVEQTDNGADALGAIIAEQPDLVLTGDRLSMMTTADLLSETALFSPLSVRAAPSAGVYCLADAESRERLLATLSRLVACRAGGARGGIDLSPLGHAATARF